MRFLADENFPGPVVIALRDAGHDVVWLRTERPGVNDSDVLTWAMQEDRILLTFDKDFGELAAKSVSTRRCGVVLVRTPMQRPADAGHRLAATIMSRDDWAGHFSVIEPGRIRMRPLG
jgi:hypothetical protein